MKPAQSAELAARSNGRFQMQTDASLVSRFSLLMPQNGVSNFVLAYAAEQRDGPRPNITLLGDAISRFQQTGAAAHQRAVAPVRWVNPH